MTIIDTSAGAPTTPAVPAVGQIPTILEQVAGLEATVRAALTDKEAALRDSRAVREGSFRLKRDLDRARDRCREIAEQLDDLRTQHAALQRAHGSCGRRRRLWRRGRHQ